MDFQYNAWNKCIGTNHDDHFEIVMWEDLYNFIEPTYFLVLIFLAEIGYNTKYINFQYASQCTISNFLLAPR